MTQPPAQPADSAPPRVGRSSVTLAVLATLLLGGAALAILVYRAITTPAPERVLVVRAASEWENVKLVVSGGGMKEPVTGTVQQAGNFVVPFFLSPGKYQLSVLSQNVEVWKQDFDLTSNMDVDVDLTRTGATTLPAPQKAATTQP